LLVIIFPRKLFFYFITFFFGYVNFLYKNNKKDLCTTRHCGHNSQKVWLTKLIRYCK